VQIPGLNGFTTAHSMARLYSELIAPRPSSPLLSNATLEQALVEHVAGQPLSGLPNAGLRLGLGFELGGGQFRPMLGEGSFGHDGAGGSLGFADRDHRVGFGFVSARFAVGPDDRADTVCRALAEDVAVAATPSSLFQQSPSSPKRRLL
jgi:CubicO group peptidase (beta-lactamase class C family)